MDIEAAEHVTNENITDESQVYLVTFSIVCLLNLAACVFICYAILKFKKLRSQVQNHYRAIIMVAILTADCIVSAYSVERAVKFRARYKVAIISVYVVLAALVVVFVGFLNFLPLMRMALFFGYIALLPVMAIFNAIHLVKRKSVALADESTLGLRISNVFVACWLPSFLILLVGMFTYNPATMWWWLSLLGIYFAYCNPIINIFLLIGWDRKFRACFLMMFRCSSSKYAGDLENLDGDAEESVIRYDHEGVSFNK